uniref:Uncharacterized protein n=1 Tax=Paramoeba aestuarina TaxID=180227 RepID=A0A7S4UF98_9EUKA|eukprot:CAMPEP_0201522364 /NCGR_PEP_ID=MMETSP0161_2-20130828/17113_1 /ASSEMBLY_ACC=CAM_ASM_000251 /TAXON_ID=180227 /ORGANISM="Neoparamoeba aestuarina, Strain SoJaBio B1-5/56/2" /LENGTH=200 /DNA_ID=CAMNT_0047921183 /DNA_START=44 /DNA_END=646 /DNA_ORIENTATION=+
MAEWNTIVSGFVLALYFLFYTGFDKASKSIKPELMTEVLLGQKGLKHSVQQLNKIFALAGLTLLGLPHFDCSWYAAFMLWIHWGVSIWQFYGKANIPSVEKFLTIPNDIVQQQNKSETIKKLSLIFGALGQLFLLSYLHLFPGFGIERVLMYALSFAVCHFYLMEVDPNFKLHVRPAGYAAFFVPIFTVLMLFIGAMEPR